MPDLVMDAAADSLLELYDAAGRRPADPVRRRAWRTVGRLGVGLQRAGRQPHLSVFELRRQRARLEAGPLGRPRDRALRDGPGGDGRSLRGREELPRPRARRRARGATATTRPSTTRRRGCPRASNRAVVREYMAHHQGMTLAALANVLCGGTMRRRFHAEPLVQSAELLLQERTPRDVAVSHPRAEEVGSRRHVRDFVTPGAPPLPVAARSDAPRPSPVERPLLGHGHGGRLGVFAVRGFGRDPVARGPDAGRAGEATSSCETSQSGRVWSAAHQPSGAEADSYDVAFYEDRVEIRRRDGAIATMLESRRVARERRGAPPGVDHEPGRPRAGARGHVLRGAGPRRSAGRRRPPRVLEPLRRDGIRPALEALVATRRTPVARRSTSSGPLTSRSSRAPPRARSSSRRTGRASSAGAAICAPRPPSTTASRCPTRSGPCSIRSSASAGASLSRRAATPA